MKFLTIANDFYYISLDVTREMVCFASLSLNELNFIYSISSYSIIWLLPMRIDEFPFFGQKLQIQIFFQNFENFQNFLLSAVCRKNHQNRSNGPGDIVLRKGKNSKVEKF